MYQSFCLGYVGEVNSCLFLPNPLDYNSKVFRSSSLRTCNSSLEGAMKLKFVSFCSS